MKTTYVLTAAAAALGAIVPAAVQAQTTVYKGYDANTSSGAGVPSNPNSSAANAQFQGVLTGTSVESFENYAAGTSPPLTLSFTGSAGTLNATLTGSGAVSTAPQSSPTGSGQFATAGSNYYAVDSSNFAITFGSPVAAFGFFATDIESDVQLIFSHVNGVAEIFSFAALFPGAGFDTASTPSGSVNFLGFTNTLNPFTAVSFGQGPNSSGDVLAFDQLTIGDARQVLPPNGAVPEPATWGMMLIGFGAAGYAMRRRARVRTNASFA